MCAKVQITLAASLLLIVLGQCAWAAVDTIPPSTVPPPPGKLILDFTNIPPPAFDREHLHFIGSLRGRPLSAPSLIWFSIFWELPSGELAYSPPVGYDVYPNFTTIMDSATTVGGCPTHVGLEFTTTSPTAITFSGTFDHQCTIPEPGSCALFALSVGCFALTAMRSRRKVHSDF